MKGKLEKWIIKVAARRLGRMLIDGGLAVLVCKAIERPDLVIPLTALFAAIGKFIREVWKVTWIPV